MKTSDVLNRAADLIEERGWAVGGGWPIEGFGSAPLCLEGGIAAALGMNFPEIGLTRGLMAPLITCPAYRAVDAYLGEALDSRREDGIRRDVWWWNDRLCRTSSEVTEVLRATAVIEAARENADLHQAVTA